MTSSHRTLSDIERHKIEAALRGLSSSSPSQAEPHLKALLHFVEGDPWVCNAVVKQTSAVSQLFSVLEGTGPSATMQGSSPASAATALEVLGILAMRTQSSRVAAPFCRLEGMRILVRQLNFYDSATDVALATFLEQLFCGSESEPARAVASTVGLIQKLVDRMASPETPPISVSAFARVFVVAAQWHIPRKQAEAHYSIESFFRFLDFNIPALVNERHDEENLSRAPPDEASLTSINQQAQAHPAAALLILANTDEESPVAKSFSHILRCLVVLVSSHADNAASACAERNLAVLARLVSVIAKDVVPSRLIATLLWFVYSIAAISPRLDEHVRNAVTCGYQLATMPPTTTTTQTSSGNLPASTATSTATISSHARPPSAAAAAATSSNNYNNNLPSSFSSTTSIVMMIVGGRPNSWSTAFASFRQLAATIPTHLETIRREHLRPEIVGEALRELCSFVNNNNNSNNNNTQLVISRALSRFVIGSPFIIKYLLLPLANVDEELVIRACQLLSFAIEGNPSAARSFLFLGGVSILKDILDDYNPLVLYNALVLTQHLEHDGWVLRELVEREIISRILHMMMEELTSPATAAAAASSCLSSSSSSPGLDVVNSNNKNNSNNNNNNNNNNSSLSLFESRSQQAEVVATSATTTSASSTLKENPASAISRELFASTLVQAALVFFRSNLVTSDICALLSHQGRTFQQIWEPLANWIVAACSNLTTSSRSSSSSLSSPNAPPSTSPFTFEVALFPFVLDAASALIRSILFLYQPSPSLISSMSQARAEKLFASVEKKIQGLLQVASSVSSNFLRKITTSSTVSAPTSASCSSCYYYPVDSPQVVSSLYFLAACCAVDPSTDGTCQMHLIKQDKAIDTVASFLSGPPGNGRVAAWTFLAAVSSRIPEAQKVLASNSLVVSGMENTIKSSLGDVRTKPTTTTTGFGAAVAGAGSNNASRNNSARGAGEKGSPRSSSTSSLDRAATIPRASGRPRSASSPFSQPMSLLQRVLECADHIFQAKSKEYGYGFALDVGRILAHPNSSMDVRSAALDVLQAMFVDVGCSSSEAQQSSADRPCIVPHIVQLLLLCEETEDAEAVTMVANRSFKLLTSLPAKQTMSTLFKIACDALEMMNITSIATLNSPFRSARNNNNNNNNNNNSDTGFESSSSWPWFPIPSLADADEAHDLMVGLLPLINGLLYHEMSFCEVFFSDSNAWSFFFILAEAEELQLGLRVLALMAFGNMISKVRNPEKISVFFESKQLQLQFTRALANLLQLKSSLDEISNRANSDTCSSAAVRSCAASLVKDVREGRAVAATSASSLALFLPDEAIETIFFILDRVSMFAKKLQVPTYFVPSSSPASSCCTSTTSSVDTEIDANKSRLLDSLLCCCIVTWNENICQFARSLLYYVFQNEGLHQQLAATQRSRLKLVLTAIVDEMNTCESGRGSGRGGTNERMKASATDTRRQAEAILNNMK